MPDAPSARSDASIASIKSPSSELDFSFLGEAIDEKEGDEAFPEIAERKIRPFCQWSLEGFAQRERYPELAGKMIEDLTEQIGNAKTPGLAKKMLRFAERQIREAARSAEEAHQVRKLGPWDAEAPMENLRRLEVSLEPFDWAFFDKLLDEVRGRALAALMRQQTNIALMGS